MLRKVTRKQRYLAKVGQAQTIPVSFATVNFMSDENLAFVIRTAACFGIDDVYVIGSIPDRRTLHAKSGSTLEMVCLHSFASPREFIDEMHAQDIKMIAAELSDEAESIYQYSFPMNDRIVLILGHETTGVPAECLAASKQLYIPMIGKGFCLNTSQTGTAMISEYLRQRLSLK